MIRKLLKGAFTVALCGLMMFTTLTACAKPKAIGAESAGGNSVNIWSAYGTEKILLEKDYSHRYSAKTISIDVCRGEHEAAQLIITPQNNVSKFTLEMSDLSLEGNPSKKLPKTSFEAFIEYYVLVETHLDPLNSTGKGSYPDALIPYANAIVDHPGGYDRINKINANENKGVYIDVNPSTAQEAGIYTGNFVVNVDGTNYNVPVSVKVYDYVLDGPKHTKSSYMANYDEINDTELDSSYEVQKSYANFIADHMLDVNSLPGQNTTIFNQDGIDRFVDQAKIYAANDNVGRYTLPYSHLETTYWGRQYYSVVSGGITHYCTQENEAKALSTQLTGSNDNYEAAYTSSKQVYRVYNALNTLKFYEFFDSVSDAQSVLENYKSKYSGTYPDSNIATISLESLTECAGEREVKIVIQQLLDASLESNIDLLKKLETYYVYYDEYTVKPEKRVRAQFTMSITPLWYREMAYKFIYEYAVNNNLVDIALDGNQKAAVQELYNRIKTEYDYNKGIERAGTEWESFAYGLFMKSLADKPGAVGREERKELYRVLSYSENLKDGNGNYIVMSASDADLLDGAFEALVSATNNPFVQGIYYNTYNIKNLCVGGVIDSIDLMGVFVPTFEMLDSPTELQKYNEIAQFWYGDRAETWAYSANGPKTPYPNYHICSELLTARLWRWTMYDYGICADLYWSISYTMVRNDYINCQNYYDDVLRDDWADGDHGEGILVYPGKHFEVYRYNDQGELMYNEFGDPLLMPVASIRLKSIREGNEEYELLYDLEDAITKRSVEVGILDSTCFENWLDLTRLQLCDNARCRIPKVNDYQDYEWLNDFAKIRTSLCNLLELANKGIVLTEFEDQFDKIKIGFSAPAGTEIKQDGTVLSPVQTVGGYDIYSVTVALNKSQNFLNLSALGVNAKIYLGEKFVKGDISKITKLASSPNAEVNAKSDDGDYLQIKFKDNPNHINPYVLLDVSKMNIPVDAKKLVFEVKNMDDNVLNVSFSNSARQIDPDQIQAIKEIAILPGSQADWYRIEVPMYLTKQVKYLLIGTTVPETVLQIREFAYVG